MRSIFLAAVLAIPAIAAAADLSAGERVVPPAASPAATSAAVTEKPVCRREDIPNSRLTKKVCHSKAEWKEIDKSSARGFG